METSLNYKYGVDDKESEKALDKVRNKEVILFSMSGRMGAGKDTIGDSISERLKNEGFKLVNVSFGYLIRKEIQDILKEYKTCQDKDNYARKLNTTKEKIENLSNLMRDASVYDRTEDVRKALQYWGTDVRREQDNRYWIKRMSEFIVDNVNKGISINVTDARFPNEAMLVEDFGGKVVRLAAPDDVLIKRLEKRDGVKINPQVLLHSSETALDSYDFEVILDATRTPSELTNEGFNYITS